jgi:hypothetical protein
VKAEMKMIQREGKKFPALCAEFEDAQLIITVCCETWYKELI